MKPQTVTAALLLALFVSLDAIAGWENYEETNVQGMVKGVIKKGSTIRMQSGSVYQLSETTIQGGGAASPKALVLRDGTQFWLTVDGFGQPLICTQIAPPKDVARSSPTISPPVADQQSDASARAVMGKLLSETDLHPMGLDKLNPDEQKRLADFFVQVYLLGIAAGRGSAPQVATRTGQPASTRSTIKSRVDGAFEGWDGNTVVRLTNGQVWQQAEYAYEVHSASMPEVIIYMSGNDYKMKIQGVGRAVKVARIK